MKQIAWQTHFKGPWYCRKVLQVPLGLFVAKQRNRFAVKIETQNLSHKKNCDNSFAEKGAVRKPFYGVYRLTTRRP